MTIDEKTQPIKSSFEEIFNLKKSKVKKVNTTKNQTTNNDITMLRSKLALPEDDIINTQQHITFAQSSLSGISRKALYASMEANNSLINDLKNIRSSNINKENNKTIKEEDVKEVKYIRY
jgi:hypothetical protein